MISNANPLVRLISIILSVTFFAQDITWAAPDIFTTAPVRGSLQIYSNLAGPTERNWLKITIQELAFTQNIRARENDFYFLHPGSGKRFVLWKSGEEKLPDGTLEIPICELKTGQNPDLSHPRFYAVIGPDNGVDIITQEEVLTGKPARRSPLGSLSEAITSINSSRKLQGHAFTKSEFKACRINPKTGKAFDDKTIGLELKGLIACGILKAAEGSKRPLRYELASEYKNAPIYVKQEIAAYLKKLRARPDANALAKAKVTVKKLLAPYGMHVQVFKIVCGLLLGRGAGNDYVTESEVLNELSEKLNPDTVKIVLRDLVKTELLSEKLVTAKKIRIFSFTRLGADYSRRKVNISDYMRRMVENSKAALKLFEWPAGSAPKSFGSFALRVKMKGFLEEKDFASALDLARQASKFLDYRGPHEKDIREAAKTFFESVPESCLTRPLSEKDKKKVDDDDDILPNERYHIRDILQYPMLTALGEVVLAVRLRFGDTNAKTKMWESNLRLVVNRAKIMKKNYKRFDKKTLELIEDFVSPGNIGLSKAIDKYEPQRGGRFSTYAVRWIEQAMQRSLQDTGLTVRIPVSRREKFGRFRDACSRLNINPKDNQYTDEVLAELTDFPVDQVKDLRYARYRTFSLDRPSFEGQTGSEDDEAAGGRFQDSTGVMDKDLIAADYREALARLISIMRSILPADSRAMQVWRLKTRPNLESTLTDRPAITLEETARQLKVTRERVRQIEAKQIMPKLIPLAQELGLNLGKEFEVWKVNYETQLAKDKERSKSKKPAKSNYLKPKEFDTASPYMLKKNENTSGKGFEKRKLLTLKACLDDLWDEKNLANALGVSLESLAFNKKKLVIAIENGLVMGSDINNFIKAVNEWKENVVRDNPRMKGLMDDLIILRPFSDTNDLKEKLKEYPSLDMNDRESNAVFVFAKDNESTRKGISGSGKAVRPVYLKEEGGSFTGRYYPLLEVVALALMKELLGTDLTAAIKKLNEQKKDCPIKEVIEDPSYILFTILPRIEMYSPDECAKRFTRVLKLLRSA